MPLNIPKTAMFRRLNGQQLRHVRESWNMSQTLLAAYLDVSAPTICRWEGRRKLAHAPNVPGWVAYALMGIQSDLEASNADLANLDATRLPR